MVLPSVDTAQSQWPRKQGGTDTSAKKRSEPPLENKGSAKTLTNPDDNLASTGAAGKSQLQALPEETFDLNDDEASSAPDFKVELTGKTPEIEQAETPVLAVEAPVYPEEARHGRKRPVLPFTFAFGVRRPMAVAVMMRNPILGADAPENRNQAIQDTLDLAATNRLPYLKGAQLNLVA